MLARGRTKNGAVHVMGCWLDDQEIEREGYRDLLVKPLDPGRLGRRDAVARLLTQVVPTARARCSSS
ncbi:MAG: hypothetical protein ACRYG2_06410 [Janthinobacterium lividum]